MAIKSPGSRIGSSVKNMKSLKVGAHGARKGMMFALNLVPMIDMFVILVVFLLITFSATGEILMQQDDIQLPKAYSGRTLERYPMIGISANVVVFEGTEVMKSGAVTEKNYPDLKLPELSKVLKAAHDTYQSNHPMPADPEKAKRWLEESKQVIIQADENVPFEVIRLVMTTAAIEGYSAINFAIQKKARAQAETAG
jgi:biopolymer transport protein ExbD